MDFLQNTRASQVSGTVGKESKPISTELASAINDCLYLYEQVGGCFNKVILSLFNLIQYYIDLSSSRSLKLHDPVIDLTTPIMILEMTLVGLLVLVLLYPNQSMPIILLEEKTLKVLEVPTPGESKTKDLLSHIQYISSGCFLEITGIMGFLGTV